jgi:exonuclease III
MRCLFWNIRGFGRRGRRTLLKEFLRKHRIDIVCLQETIKKDFTDTELRSLEVGEKFVWVWLPGHSGGMLMGFKDSFCEVGIIDRGRFFISAVVLCRTLNLRLEIMGIYEPADHSHSQTFLAEISNKISSSVSPLLVGGDFNLIRGGADKNNDNINWARVDMFNEAIGDWALREIPRTGARYTWSNRQLNPVRSVLDRVFISPELEPAFPLCTVTAETSLGSDHTPLIFDSGEELPIRSN